MEDWTKLTKKEWWPMLECIFLAIIVTFIEKYHLLLAKNQQLFITKVMVLEEILMFLKIMEDIDQNIILDNQETDYLKIVWEMSNKVLKHFKDPVSDRADMTTYMNWPTSHGK